MCQVELNNLPETEIYRFVKETKQLVARAVPKYSSKYSRQDYTLRQHAVLICLKIKKNDSYREVIDETIEMLRIRKTLGLKNVPDPSTLCRAFQKLTMKTWRILLNLTWKKLDLTGIVGIDATSFERNHASHHYTKRTKLKIQNLKTTLLTDKNSTIMDIHITTTRKHDTQIAPNLIKRNQELINIILGDKGYDSENIRKDCKNRDIKPIIKYREFTEKQEKLNKQIDNDLYNQRNINETINSSLKRKFNSHVASKTWYKQFRELTIKCIIQNIENKTTYIALSFRRVATKPVS